MGRHPHLGRFQTLSKKDKKIINNALEITQIEALKDRNMNELSGGEGQLSIIARALATEASLILLDEPTSNLDIQHTLTIMDLLGDLKAKGKTILVSIHDLNLARRYCDTISIIDGGKIIALGSPAELKSQIPGNDMVFLAVDHIPDHLNERIRNLPFVHKIETDEGSLRTYVDNGAQNLPALIDVVKSLGADIRSVSIHAQSLEDVFIHYTGKSIRDEEAKKVSMLIGAGIPQKLNR